MIFKDLHNAYGHIKYIDHNHTYLDTISQKYLISVTTLVKRYIESFDVESNSKRMSEKPKEKRTQDQIKAEWNRLRILGAAKGTILHNYLENLWNNKLYQIDYDSQIPKLSNEYFIEFHNTVSNLIKMADSFYKDHKNIIPVKTELIVGNDKIAGQIDLLAYDTDLGGYTLIDYKTDKKMHYKSFYGNKMLNELSHLDECELNKYSLQLNFYKELLKPVVDIKEIYVIWFNEKNDTYKKIKLKNLDRETRIVFSGI